MKRRFLMYCSALALMATAVFTGSTISYGQENSEISDFGDGTDTEIYSELSEEVLDTDNIADEEEFDDGDVAEMNLPEDEEVPIATAAEYTHSESDVSGEVTLKVEWNDPVLGEPLTFHVSGSGGSGRYIFRMDAPSYSNPNKYTYESVADPSRGEWIQYTAECTSYDYNFTMTASGTYNFRFYIMDKTAGVYYLRVSTYIQVSDESYPSVNSIVESAVAQCNSETNGSEYEKALWLHDWLIQQLDYDNSLKWSSAESALTRRLGTCQAYESAYSRLLTAAGIENAETRDTYDGHTWNAMKLDGEWYQVDCTWDDSKDHWYNFDQTRLYFGLTDELMAIAHPGHAKIYTGSGYGTRSTSLEDNYFVRSGDAQTWAEAYVERIQENLNDGNTEFTVAADNASYPPSISGIQNGIIAYMLNQMDWSVDGEKVSLQTTGSAAEFTFTAVKNGSVIGDKFYGYTLNPNGTIAINMYMNLPDEVAANQDSYMEFTLPDGTTSTMKVADARRKDEYYIFSCKITAREMADDVTAKMIVDSQTGKKYTVSVQKYAEYIITHPEQYSATAVQLVKSMLNYGAAAQTLFNYHTETLANSILGSDDQAVAKVDFQSYKSEIEKTDNTGIRWYGGSLLLKSGTCIRDYFILDETSSINEYSFYNNSTKLEPVERVIDGTTYYYVEIPDIKAQNLDKAVEVRVQKSDEPNVDIIKLQYNAFSYAYDLANMENSDANTKAVTYALYQYWKMAQQYVEENKNS